MIRSPMAGQKELRSVLGSSFNQLLRKIFDEYWEANFNRNCERP
jgi:hypothetical protein